MLGVCSRFTWHSGVRARDLDGGDFAAAQRYAMRLSLYDGQARSAGLAMRYGYDAACELVRLTWMAFATGLLGSRQAQHRS